MVLSWTVTFTILNKAYPNAISTENIKVNQLLLQPLIAKQWITTFCMKEKANGVNTRDPTQVIRLGWHRPASSWLQYFENTVLVTETIKMSCSLKCAIFNQVISRVKILKLKNKKICIPLLGLILLSILNIWMKQQNK